MAHIYAHVSKTPRFKVELVTANPTTTKGEPI